MVLGRVEVGEGDICADGNDRQERMELQILLRHNVASAGVRNPGAGRRIKRDDRIAHGAPGRIDDTHRERRRDERRRCAGERQRKQKSTHHDAELSPRR